MLIHKLQQKLLARAESNSLRKLTTNKGLTDFFSNDYLGLARNKALYEAILLETEKVSANLNGSTGSRLLSGNHNYIIKLEEQLASLFHAEKTLLFNSGYNANLSILSAIPQKGDTIIYDELIHASLKDGARLSFANRFSFRHNDVVDLELKLQKATGEKFVVIESVYSMDGDFAAMNEIILVCKKYNAYIILDEAHSTGVYGKNGNGLACSEGIENNFFARIYTFGKGMGIHGACIAGSKILIDYLVNYARPFIYTTSLPAHSLASVKCAFEYLHQHPELQKEIKSNIDFFKATIQFELGNDFKIISDSPIQVIKIAGNTEVKKISQGLKDKGFDVRPILSPTVKEGEERLRICLHVFNTETEIKNLIGSIKNLL